MGNRRKKETALWLVFLQGVGLALGIYLLLMVLASALLVGAVLPEAGTFPAAAVGCCLASWAGAMTCVRRSPWGSLPSAMTCAGGFLQTGSIWGWADSVHALPPGIANSFRQIIPRMVCLHCLLTFSGNASRSSFTGPAPRPAIF